MSEPQPYTPKFSKYVDGKTVREAREDVKAGRRTVERLGKDSAKKDDGGRCRWPHCDCRKIKQPMDGAHLDAKGMGGNPKGDRHDPRNIITLCREVHRTGRKSLHSGDRRITPLTEDGTRGPCLFEMTDEHGRWFVVAEEREPFIYIRD
jgi:hypothetical protein